MYRVSGRGDSRSSRISAKKMNKRTYIPCPTHISISSLMVGVSTDPEKSKSTSKVSKTWKIWASLVQLLLSSDSPAVSTLERTTVSFLIYDWNISIRTSTPESNKLQG